MWSLLRKSVTPVRRLLGSRKSSIITRRVHDKTGRREWSESDSGHVTGVRVINSLLNHDRLVPLKTREPDTVTWYTCGPTVYDHAHLGHARNYVTVDILHRVLKEFFRLDVHHVLGMTDIDDKILNRARDQQVSPVTLARQFEREFFADMRAMNVQAPTVVTRVSEHVPEIQQFVEQITKNGYAYKAASDSVYFDVTAFQQQHYYGKLKPEVNLVPESDPDQAGQEKRAARDFALWKSQDGGRPGWHIECVAMSHAILGKHFDVHSGGIDLKFPHHNNEVAIADAYLNGDRCQHASDTAHEWVNYFLHVGHLNIKGLKMSKSLKNFITVKEYLSQYGADEFRLFCLMSPYHSTLDYTEQRVVDARQVFKRFDEFFSLLGHVIRRAEQQEHVSHRWYAEEHALHASLSECQSTVRSALSDNFDTHRAVTALLSLTARTAHYVHATQLRGHVLLLLALVRDYVARILSVFGLQCYAHVTDAHPSSHSPSSTSSSDPLQSYAQLLDVLVQARHELRGTLLHALKSSETREQIVQRLLPLVDKMRDDLVPLGIKLEDSKGGTLVKHVRSDPRTEAALQQMRTKSKQRTEELKEPSSKQ